MGHSSLTAAPTTLMQTLSPSVLQAQMGGKKVKRERERNKERMKKKQGERGEGERDRKHAYNRHTHHQTTSGRLIWQSFRSLYFSSCIHNLFYRTGDSTQDTVAGSGNSRPPLQLSLDTKSRPIHHHQPFAAGKSYV